MTTTLRNEGTLQLDGARDVTATCIAGDDEHGRCREKMTLSLPDGFAPASESFTLRLPMGVTNLKFDYGQDEPLALDIDVPERILGVDRDLWECYTDRPTGGVEIDGENFAGCGGWGSPIVEKWGNDVPVKVWATGRPDYIAVLETILSELSPILNLEFQWVDAEQDADFKAFVGMSPSEADSLGFGAPLDDFYVDEAWGFASANVNRGEATSGYIVVWHLDRATSIDEIRGVTLHEALHALVPIGHRVPLGHSSRPLSVLEYAKPGVLIPRERQLLKINSHPLVRPGMSMDDVRKLIVLTEELLDYSPVESETVPDDPLDLILRAYVELERAGSASFRLSGGWIDRACNYTFGVRRGPIEITIGDFRLFEDDPAILYLNMHTNQFYIFYSRAHQGWTHWELSPEGVWERVDHQTIQDASSWWVWNGKLHAKILGVLRDGSSEDIGVDETDDGKLRIQATLDESGEGYSDLTLLVDPKTFAIAGYTWELHRDPTVYSGLCLTYKETATDGRLGVAIELPESVKNELAGATH